MNGMKALFIGSDQALHDAASVSSVHQRGYAEALGTLHILMRTEGASEVRRDGPLTVHFVSAGKLDANALVAYARALIAAEGIEVVSAQDPFEHGWVAKEAVKGTAAALHIQVHSDFLSPWFLRGGISRSPQVAIPVKNSLRRHLADLTLPKAAGIRVVSERVKQSLLARYGSRIPEPVVIPLAVSMTVPEAVPLPPHAFTFALVTTGPLVPEKRIEDIIEALYRIKDTHPAVGLVVIGEGSERERLMTLVTEKQLMGRVIFAGERADSWGLMRSCQVYIQSSGYEGYGRDLVEAALVRLPIITTDVGIVGEVFQGYDDVLATPPGDPTNLAYQIIALLEDVGARETMVRSAQAKVQQHLAAYVDVPRLIAADLARLVSALPVV